VFPSSDGAAFEATRLADLLRARLWEAQVRRPELHNEGENRGRFRVHDLRGTLVTLSLANGKSETWVAGRTGHPSSIMINRYRRAARTASELNLGNLVPLDEALGDLADYPWIAHDGANQRTRRSTKRAGN
jgi:integrase